MIPVRFNIHAQENTSLDVLFGIEDCEENPMDLTGYTALMEVKDRVGGTVLETLSTENGKIILGGEDGTIQLYIEDLTIMSGVYDLLLTSPSGTKYKPIKTSKYVVEGGVTV